MKAHLEAHSRHSEMHAGLSMYRSSVSSVLAWMRVLPRGGEGEWWQTTTNRRYKDQHSHKNLSLHKVDSSSLCCRRSLIISWKKSNTDVLLLEMCQVSWEMKEQYKMSKALVARKRTDKVDVAVDKKITAKYENELSWKEVKESNRREENAEWIMNEWHCGRESLSNQYRSDD